MLFRRFTSQISRTWADAHEFLHVPVDARTVAVVRIAFASLLLINALCWWPDLDRWFSEAGVVGLENSRQAVSGWSLSLFWVLPTDHVTLRLAYGLFLLQIIGLIVGWKSRVQAIGCYVWLVSFQHRNAIIFDGEDTMFRIINFLLMFMPLGNVWSVDSRMRSRSGMPPLPVVVDGWSVRLLQLEMAMVYFSAAWCKLLGAPWRHGTALYYVSRLDDYWGRFPIPTFVLETPWIIRGLTWSTMAIEFSVPVLIWFSPTRRVALGMVLVFHLACDYAMHLFLFHWFMLAGWLAFLETEDFQWVDRLRTRKTDH